MRTLSLAAVTIVALAMPALAQDRLSNVGLSNMTIGAHSGGLGTPGLNNSASMSGTRLEANTNVTNRYVGVSPDQINAGNANVVGVVQTTTLQGGSASHNEMKSAQIGEISGSGNLNGYNNTSGTSNLGGSTLNNAHANNASYNIDASGKLAGGFDRAASSNAATGLSGYSGSQLMGPGSVSGHIDGNALVVSGAVSGAAGLR
jgi:hypothetical protein